MTKKDAQKNGYVRTILGRYLHVLWKHPFGVSIIRILIDFTFILNFINSIGQFVISLSLSLSICLSLSLFCLRTHVDLFIPLHSRSRLPNLLLSNQLSIHYLFFTIFFCSILFFLIFIFIHSFLLSPIVHLN